MNDNGEVTTREAAARLGVSQRTITRYIHSGALEARRVSATGRSGIFVIPVSELEAFIANAQARWAPRLPDEFLRNVAQVYTAADGSPRQALAKLHGKSVNTVDGWIAACRRRGFLPSYVRGNR